MRVLAVNRLGVIYFRGLEFEVEVARFGYVRTSHWGAGWNFLIGGFCSAGERTSERFPEGLMFYSEAAPLTLNPGADLLTQVVEHPGGFYPDSDWGATWFECWRGGHNETCDVNIRFVERNGSRYRVELSATVLDEAEPARLRAWAWCEFRPVQERPTGFGLAPRRGTDLSQLRFVEQDGHQLWTCWPHDGGLEVRGMPLSLHQGYTADQAVALFSAGADAEYFCDRQFAMVPGATLCFATMGDPDTGTKLVSPSKVAWKPARLDYHPEEGRPWLPERLTESVERNGAWLPLYQMFLRASGDQKFIYAGIGELTLLGAIQESGRLDKAAHFSSPLALAGAARGGVRLDKAAHFKLDAKLPQHLWIRLGGYAGWLVGFNQMECRLASDDVADFEQLLAAVPTPPGLWVVSLTGYEDYWFAVWFNARRARLRYGPAESERALESWDPACTRSDQCEVFGDLMVTAERTVPRELGVRAAVEYFRTGRLPQSVRWREIEAW